MITEVLVAKAEIKTMHGSCRLLVITPLQKKNGDDATGSIE